ncbi:hypothetical protein Q5424_16015 [Conexibacter sp. JD483]|uniref:hypothetical protein n=1 Tax=unclassified Conexibacter TaxID=2627773 RepID=UPI00271964E5|nr:MULTISPECIES: hypothetical protein [unclassified Conexibacter]MDO8186655.1 hypothetical protein [Conexibacter sp. CPCC 205706]MDO8200375.1 hypothetical protein [Conexibacter sp. CPCC 205762]MDR9370603.1 hypothetical protein [Conexibacter sp. JD483]
MTQAVRNVVIILALAAGVAFIPGGGRTSNVITQILSIVMFTALAYLAVRLFRERRLDLYGLGDRNRAILYGCAALVTFLLVAASRMWNSGAGGTVAWFALVAAAVYGVYYVFRAAREY